MLLTQALKGAAGSRVALVASDYDGTLAPIVADPDLAFPDRRALPALVALGALPNTHAAILSGRDVAVLQRLTKGPPGVELVGSHGAEPAGRAPDVDAQAAQDLNRARVRLVDLSRRLPGSRLEVKPAGVAFHFRNVSAERRPAARSAAQTIGLEFPRLTVLEGKQVVELTGSRTHKGHALLTLRDRWGADVVVFIGDDVTDEDAFASLQPADVGIKVGDGPTRARFRVDDQTQVAQILESLLAYRRDRRKSRC